MWRITNPFSAWVLPLRLLGIAAFLYAFVRLLVTPDLTLIVVAIIGSLLWQAGTAAEEHSPLYRRLESTAVREIMRTRPIRVRSWIPILRFKSEHPNLSSTVFIVTVRDGYDTGVSTPEELSLVSDEAVRYTSVGQFAHPLSYVDGLRPDDPVLEAFLRFRRTDAGFVPVLGEGEVLAGVIARHDLDEWLKNRARAAGPLHLVLAENETIEKKLAA
jgi:hypothetical protein